MENQVYDIASLIIILLSVYPLIVSRRWQWLLIALSLQYLGAFILVSGVWQLELAVVKLVAGWMAAAILGVTQVSESSFNEDNIWPMGAAFRMFACSFFILLAFSLAPLVYQLFPDFGYYQVVGGVMLLSTGFLKLGLSNSPIHIILGLLTIFSGFEILFASAEKSVLVAGLLAAMNLGLAVVGAYLHVSPSWGDYEGKL